VAFLKVMVQNLIRQGLADRERIYLTGASNGGMMSLRMGCEAAELFAGIAPVIANLPTDIAGSCKPRRPTPMLMINGTADPLVPWGGGVGFGGRRRNVLSTEETIAIWRRANGCSENATPAKPPAKQDVDQSRAEVLLYKDCRSGAPVAVVRIEGGGHRIPGREDRPHPVIDRVLGSKNHDFEAAELVWQFFARPSDF
jgi:polyhydroxybutyrate depolymerase